MYVYTSQTIHTEYISDGIVSSGMKGKSCAPRGYIQVDALWDTEIDVINPFAVKGTLRISLMDLTVHSVNSYISRII